MELYFLAGLAAISIGEGLALLAQTGLVSWGTQKLKKKAMKSRKWKWALPYLNIGVNLGGAMLLSHYGVNPFGDDMAGTVAAGMTASGSSIGTFDAISSILKRRREAKEAQE